MPGPMDDPLARLAHAETLLDEGELERAERAVEPLLRDTDRDVAARAWLIVATARYRADAESGALEAWQSAAATDGASAWIGWRSVAEQQVRNGDLRAAVEAYREAERRAPADERGPIANRLGWLNKELGHDFEARRQFNRARAAYGSYLPVVTYTILAITVLVALADAVLAGTLGADLFGRGGPLVLLGAVSGPAVQAGEWYRIFTSAFLHLGLLHLAFNMYSLYLFGPMVERMYGHLEFAVLYLLCAAGGSILTVLLQPFPGAVGASGAIFGLFGLVFVVGRRHKVVAGGQTRAVMGQVGTLLIINLVFTFVVPGISWTGHLGGLAVGALLGFLLPPTGAATLGSLWRTPQGGSLQREVPLGLRAVAYLAVAALLVAGGYYASVA